MPLPDTLSDFPQALAERASAKISTLPSSFLESLNATQTELLTRIMGTSPFVSDFVNKHPNDALQMLEESSPLFHGKSYQQMHDELTADVASCETEDGLMAKLRTFRNREQARIIWRDFSHLADLDCTLSEVSSLADVCIQVALSWLFSLLSSKYGVPKDKSGRTQHLIVLGMGKLGARELNVSSDIDLIFAYPRSGQTDHPRKCLDNQQFFTKLGQRLIHVLDARTSEGFVYRVDMRLRPYGSSGALAMNFSSFEDYFQTQGREWERFAMLKARAITGEPDDVRYLTGSIIRPFVYRKYPDYSSFQALRDMKRLIKAEVHRKGGELNIKLGEGGIREIEFIAQATQLIYGGRDARLCDTGLQSVYRTLTDAEYLPADWVKNLLAAYRFLRDMEHRIQGYRDQQTQLLPQDPEAKASLVYTMGAGSWDDLVATMSSLRAKVSEIFDDFLHEDEQEDQRSKVSEFHWLQLWRGKDEDAEAWQDEFKRAGFDDPVACANAIIRLHEAPRFRMMSASARDRFEVFLPRLLDELVQSDPSAQTLTRALEVVKAVLGRTIYLVLLIENDQALRQLCKLCAESQWFADHIAATPVVLDDLLDPKSLYHPPPRDTLADELRQLLLRIPEDDLEMQMDCLRNFKQSHMLRVAAAEISDVLPVMKVSDYLTWLAEACLEAALEIAWRNLVHKHGRPSLKPSSAASSGFAVIGYGKLGGIELGYQSDLDIVFLYDADDFGSTDGAKPINNQVFYTRLGQRLMHILGAQTSQGICYEVDMRLRPSGNSGMLVSSLAAFEKYQRNDAWTWEHQALVRARFVAGDPVLSSAFTDIRNVILRAPRDREALLNEVAKMRQKMRDAAIDKFKSSELARGDIKQGEGGLIDIEFISQYLILAYACDHDALTQWTDNVRQLESLSEALDLPIDCIPLIDAYRILRSALHRKSLSGQSGRAELGDFPEQAELVRDAFAKLFKENI